MSQGSPLFYHTRGFCLTSLWLSSAAIAGAVGAVSRCPSRHHHRRRRCRRRRRRLPSTFVVVVVVVVARCHRRRRRCIPSRRRPSCRCHCRRRLRPSPKEPSPVELSRRRRHPCQRPSSSSLSLSSLSSSPIVPSRRAVITVSGGEEVRKCDIKQLQERVAKTLSQKKDAEKWIFGRCVVINGKISKWVYIECEILKRVYFNKKTYDVWYLTCSIFGVCYFKSIKCKCAYINAKKNHVWHLKSENVQCDILPASNDSEHIIIPIFSSVYILPISPILYCHVIHTLKSREYFFKQFTWRRVSITWPYKKRKKRTHTS